MMPPWAGTLCASLSGLENKVRLQPLCDRRPPPYKNLPPSHFSFGRIAIGPRSLAYSVNYPDGWLLSRVQNRLPSSVRKGLNPNELPEFLD